MRKRVSPWWREDVLGNIALTVRVGGRAIEFEKGKTAILVPGMDQLGPTAHPTTCDVHIFRHGTRTSAPVTLPERNRLSAVFASRSGTASTCVLIGV